MSQSEREIKSPKAVLSQDLFKNPTDKAKAAYEKIKRTSQLNERLRSLGIVQESQFPLKNVKAG